MSNFLLILVVCLPTLVHLQSEPGPPHDIPVGRPVPLAASPMEDYRLGGYPITADNLLHDFPPERSPDYLVDGPPPLIRRGGRRRYSYPMTRSPPLDTYPRPPMLERHPERPMRPPYVRRPIIDPYYEEIRPYDRVAFQPMFRRGFRRRSPPRYRPDFENPPHINGEFGPIVQDRRSLPYTSLSSSRRLPGYRSSEFTRRPFYPRRGRFLSSGRKDRIFREQRRDRRGDGRLNDIGFPRQADYLQNEIDPSREETFIDASFSERSSYPRSGYRHQDYDFTSDYNTPTLSQYHHQDNDLTSDYNTPRLSQHRPPSGGLSRLITRNDNFPPDLSIRDPTIKRRRRPHPSTETDPFDTRNTLTRKQAILSRRTDFGDHPRHVRSSNSPSNLILKRSERSPRSPRKEINTETRNAISSIQDGFISEERSTRSPGKEMNTETRNAITSIQDGFISESVNAKPARTSDKIISKSRSVNIESSSNISKNSEINKRNPSQREYHGSLAVKNTSKSSSTVENSTKEATKNTDKQYNTSFKNNNERQDQYFDIHNVLSTPLDKSFITHEENQYSKKIRKIGSANTFIKTTPHSITIPVPLGFDLSKSSNMVVDLTKSIPENNQEQQTSKEIFQISTPNVNVPAINTDERGQFESHTLSPENLIPGKIPNSSTNDPTGLRRVQFKTRKGRMHSQNGSTNEHQRRRGQRRYRGSTASNNRETSSRPRSREPGREEVVPRRIQSSSSSTIHRDKLLHDNLTRMDRPVQRPGQYLSNSERSRRQNRVSQPPQRPIQSSRRLYRDGPPPSRGQRRRISSTVDKIPRRRVAPSERPYRVPSTRSMDTESRDRPNFRRRFRQYTNDSSFGRSLEGSSDSTRPQRRQLPSRTYPKDYNTDNLTPEIGPIKTSQDRNSYDSLDERYRAIDSLRERQLSPGRTRTDTQTIPQRQRTQPEDASPRRRLSSTQRVPTGRSPDIEVQRHRRLPTRRPQEYVPYERARGSPLLESSHPDILSSPRTQYIDEPIVYSNRSSQITDEIPVSPRYDIPERSIRGYSRPSGGVRSRDESFIGLPSERRRLPATARLYPDEISEPQSSDRQGFRRDRTRPTKRPESRLRRRPPVSRRRYLEESVLVPRREARREIPLTRREPLSSERTTRREYSMDHPVSTRTPYTDETFVAPPGRRFADDITTPYHLPPSRRSSLEESSVAPSLERSRPLPGRAASMRRGFTESSVYPTLERSLELEAPRRRPRGPRELSETSRVSYPARATDDLRFRSFPSRDQYANESSIPPFPSVDLPQRRIASSERRPLSTRRYAIEPQVTERSASLPERRRIRVKSRRPRPLRYRVPRREVTSLPPRRRRLPPRSASRSGPILQNKRPLTQRETSSITAPFRQVAQVSLRVNETSSLPRVPTPHIIHRDGLPSLNQSRSLPRRRPVVEQESGDRRSIPEVRRQPIRYKPSVSQQISVPSRYNDTVSGVRLGVVRARGGENGFPIHGGFCPGEGCADGGLAAGVANGTGTGTLEAFLERRRTGANEDIIAYKRELGSLTIT